MQEQRKTKIINPAYQYRQALGVVLFGIIGINLLIVVQALFSASGDSAFSLPLPFYAAIAFAELAVLAGAWYWAIQASHRVAGPVYAMGRELDKLCQGDLCVRIRLRDGDEFSDTAERINRGIASLRQEIAGIKGLVAQMGDQPSAAQMTELRSSLDRLITERNGRS